MSNFSEFLEEFSKCTGSCILISVLGVCMLLCVFFSCFALCGWNSRSFRSFPFAEVCEKTDGSRDYLIFGALLLCNEMCVFFSSTKILSSFVYVFVCVCVCVFFLELFLFLCVKLCGNVGPTRGKKEE